MQRQDMPTSAFHSDGAEGRRILAELASMHDVQRYREYHWEGSFADYLEIVTKNPKVARSAFQRIYDMIMHFGYTEYTEHKEKLIHYHFFDDPVGNGEDAIYGLDRYLMVLVNIFKSAARRYGTERRIILLHGPVGSSKSTIVRLLKKGLEYHTRLPEGALYSFSWVLEDGSVVPCPLNEEPLKLIPPEVRVKFLERLNEGKSEEEQIWVEGDLCPLCRFYFREFMRKYQGDWQQVVENHIRVRRVIFSEKDRIGIGTFQPKDEKCLHGSTLCATERGLLPLQDLFLNLNGNRPKEGEFALLQIVVQSVTKRTGASHLYFDGVKPMLEVQTKFGYSLVGTSNHRVMVLEDGELKWKRLGELRKGDYVALYRGANSFGSNRTLPSVDGYNLPQSATILDEDMAYWLGLLVADGSVTVFDVWFTNTSEQLLHFFVEFGQRRFGVQGKIYRKKGHKVANAVLESKDLARWLASDVGVRRSAESKQVPPAILQAPREIVLAFLAGLFDGDGCFRLKSNGVNEFTFSSASKTLAKQVHLLLLNLGVVASLYEQVIDGKPYYSIVARGDSVCELNETLPLRLKKRTDLAPVKGREAKWDILPNVEPLLAEFPELPYYFRRILETERRLTRAKAKELLARLPSDNPKVKFLRWLVEAPIIWLPVIKISPVSEAPAFDLSIPVWQAYVADGFVVHNSQDATELTGDINYRKIAVYGSESDPRAFDFDGEFCIANRGLLEFIELLKLETEFLYDLLGATQEHVIKPRKFAQVDIDEVILGHSVAGDTPIPYLHRPTGTIGFTTIEELFERFANRPEELMVLSVNEQTKQPEWTPVRGLFRHKFTGQMLQTAQKWGVIETTPNHALYDREMRLFRPIEMREVMAVRHISIVWTPAREVKLEVEALVGGEDERWIVQPKAGWARLALPRYATQIKVHYRLPEDAEDLNALLTLIAWYVAEGHVNGDNGGVVISCSDPEQLEQIREAYQRVTTAKGYIDKGAKTDSTWRLYLGSEAIGELLVSLCGRGSAKKRLPDFVFTLPLCHIEHLWAELMRADGSRTPPKNAVSESYRARYFDYRTISPMLAAQIGFLASLLGMDYSVYLWKRTDGKRDAYRIRFCSGEGKQGGRHRRYLPRLFARETVNEWVYDIECEGNHNFVCGIGNVCAHNTNEPEYRKLQKNEYMEALRDRTIKVDIPYVLKLSDEVKIYEKFFNPKRVKGKHIAPHTLEIAAMWAILTRLEEPKKFNLTLMQKLKLYDGKALPGFTEDHVIELREEAPREGMFGISPRYVMDKISNALVSEENPHCVNPFMVMKELDEGLDHYSLVSTDEQRKRYRELLALVRQEYEEIIKNEVRRAITADEEALKRLCQNYIENVKAYVRGEKVRNRYTGELEEPDERLMRSIEEKIDIPESRKDDFRREIMNYIASLALEGKQFDYKSNERLLRALELKLFEDQKDSIRLSAIATGVVDKETQEKIDVIKARLIREYGYCEVCATDILTYVASIFARGDIKEREEARR